MNSKNYKSKRFIPRHITKLFKAKDKQSGKQQTKKQKVSQYKGSAMRWTAYCSSDTMEARKQGNDISKLLDWVLVYDGHLGRS